MSRDKSGGPLVQVSGGTLNVQAMAVGAQARATVNNAAAALAAEGRDELLARLTAVLEALEALEAHGAALPDAPTAQALVERIATEAASKKPDKLTLGSFLASLADQVKSVAGIATAVTALAGTVGALFV